MSPLRCGPENKCKHLGRLLISLGSIDQQPYRSPLKPFGASSPPASLSRTPGGGALGADFEARPWGSWLAPDLCLGGTLGSGGFWCLGSRLIGVRLRAADGGSLFFLPDAPVSGRREAATGAFAAPLASFHFALRQPVAG